MHKITRLTVAVLALFTATLTGCDRHKDERASLLKEVAKQEANLARQNEQRTAVSIAIAGLNSDLKREADSLPHHSQRRAKLQDDLSSFLLDHKMATAALLATGGGAAAFIDTNVDEETKKVFILVGVVGAIYCLANSDECADVTARVLYFGSQIEAENKIIADTSSRLDSMKTAIQAKQKELASLDSTIAKQQGDRDALKKKHDSLVCQFCL